MGVIERTGIGPPAGLQFEASLLSPSAAVGSERSRFAAFSPGGKYSGISDLSIGVA